MRDGIGLHTYARYSMLLTFHKRCAGSAEGVQNGLIGSKGEL